MINKINIVDGNKHIDLILINNKIYVISNEYVSDINKYLNYLKTDNINYFYSVGENTCLYKGKGKKNNKKKFHFGKITIILSYVTFIALNTVLLKNYEIHNNTPNIPHIEDYSTSDLHTLIDSSNGLNTEEKDFIYNKYLLEDVLEVINKDDYLKYLYQTYFNDIKIISFNADEYENQYAVGYYNTIEPNVIHVRDYEELDDFNKDTISHEFIHLCQETTGYNLIIEASAEIISNEYYNTPLSSYYDQVKLLKVLMEIIGSKPIWIYNFSGDFSLIEERVKPFLSEEDYIEFLSDLTFKSNEEENNIKKFNSLRIILSKLYKAIYNKDIENDNIINLIINDDSTLERYYFNKRLINYSNSYYYNYIDKEYKEISLEDAVNDNLIKLYAIKKIPLDKESAISLSNNNDYPLDRIINYKSAEIIITKTTNQNNKMYISGSINGISYIDYDIDDLVMKGIIDVDYYLVNFKYLTIEEYRNHDFEEGSLVNAIIPPNITSIDEEKVCGLFPRKDYLKLTSDIYSNRSKSIR